MKNKFEEEFNQLINEKKEMPEIVRQSLDQSYDRIRAASKKKTTLIGRSVMTAACALLITGIAFTNENVMAGINNIFNFGDGGIEQAVNNGFTQEDHHSVTDQNISITLDKHLSDANKLGISFQLAFEDTADLTNAEEVFMDYRIKNGDGEYIGEFIPDTKTLKGDNRYISDSEHTNPVLDAQTGKIQYDVLFNSNEGSLPPLSNATIEIESVNIFYQDGTFKKIDGSWTLSVTNQTVDSSDLTVQYAAQDESSVIQVTKASASPTSFNLTFSLDGTYEDENTFAGLTITDEHGDAYQTTGFKKSTANNETKISVNFPLTAYDNTEKLTLSIEGIGEVELHKQ